jgi:hexosaminidase
MDTIPTLLPAPVELQFCHGLCDLRHKSLILLESDHPQTMVFSALRLQLAINTHLHIPLEIYAGKFSQLDQVGIILRFDPNLHLKPQGYRLQITPSEILVEAQQAEGIFYACCTLIQLVEYYTFPPAGLQDLPLGCLPCLAIQDWPDFLYRGVMLDISRDKVPTMQTMFDLVDMLASWKINQLQLYTEHTFAYHMHPEVWANASPFTGEEILKLDAFCHERFIELVPNQNSFGHMERWLKHPRYLHLAEAPNGFDFPWGHSDGPFSLCPLDPESITFLQGLYDELLPHFSSQHFNIGCDETFDLGQGRSKAECERLGTSRVYLDFLFKLYHEVNKRGFRMQFWGDIIISHPELVTELPKDAIALEWGYEADHPFAEHGEKFSQAGISFYVCPGTSSWNSLAGRTDNCLMNLSNAAQNGMKYGAKGYLITDWGDNGHWQVLPVSFLGFAAGAAYSWRYAANHNLDVRGALSLYAFHDRTSKIGTFLYDLGNIYHQVKLEPPNNSALFIILQQPTSEWQEYWQPESALQIFQHALENLEQITQNNLPLSTPRSDGEILKRELMLTRQFLRHACMRALHAYGSTEYNSKVLLPYLEEIINEYQWVWLMRNRPGGLNDSLAHFEIAKKEYQES